MKVMFIVYHDIKTNARSQEILECAQKLGGETVFVSYSTPFDTASCKCILTGEGKRDFVPFIRGAIKAIKKENPDIVILHDNYTALVLRWLKKHRKNIYVIYDSSELYIEFKTTKSIKRNIANLNMYFEKKYLKSAKIVLAANIERANIMKDFFKLREVPIVFNNVHRIDDSYNKIECDKKYGDLYINESFCIFYGGGISESRLTFDLVDVVGKLGGKYSLIVSGISTETAKRQFYSMLEEKKYSNVFYVGFIPRNELRYILSRSKISVSIFAQDTVNNINCASGKFFEGLFEGTPMLTSENPPLKRICTEYKVGVSTKNFTDGILELEKNYDYYCNNVEKFTNRLDVKGRIDELAEKLVIKMEKDNVRFYI